MSTTQLSEAATALKHSPHPALRGLHIEQIDERIILKGQVSSYYLKQLAQETVMAAYPGQEIVNEVQVDRIEDRGSRIENRGSRIEDRE